MKRIAQGGARTSHAQKRVIGGIRQDSAVRGGPRYGILGGTFDPPHVGHLVLAQEVFVRLRLDRVWFVPAGAPPHKSGRVISAAEHRRAMVELAIAGDPRFALSTVELDRNGPSYTSDTLMALRGEWGEQAWMAFAFGWDMLLYLPQWHEPERVVSALDCLAAFHRPGTSTQAGELDALETRLPGLREKLEVLPSPQLEISASSLRERVASGLPIRYLVPDAVDRYIEDHGLYRLERAVRSTSDDVQREEETEA